MKCVGTQGKEMVLKNKKKRIDNYCTEFLHEFSIVTYLSMDKVIVSSLTKTTKQFSFSKRSERGREKES